MKGKAHLLVQISATIAFSFGAGVVAPARTIHVDANGTGDYPTIQAAIDDANNGDTIILQPRTYTGDGNRDIDFNGKTIMVRSVNPKDPKLVAATFIDCDGTELDTHRGFYFHNGENHNSILDGLTIKNGYSNSRGGGILCEKAAPRILNCIITDNYARSGGGIYCSDATDLAIINCTIGHNTCDSSGAGIFCLGSSVLINRCVVTRNLTTGRFSEYGWGAGISCSHCDVVIADGLVFDNVCSYVGGGFDCSYSSATLTNCTFVGNSAEVAGGIYCGYYGDATVANCIVWDNTAAQGPQIRVDPGYDVSVRYSDIKGGQADVSVSSSGILKWADGNIDMDPCFADAAASHYHLRVNSPCIDAGDPNHLPFTGEADIDGHRRIFNGRVDIGADEFGSVPAPTLDVWPKELSFFVYEGEPSPQPRLLLIQNRAAGTLSWKITYNCPWLHVSDTEGQSIDNISYVTVGADVSGLGAGTHNCQLTISADDAFNSPKVVDVNFVIYGPEIELSATHFEFDANEGGANPEDQILTIRNNGGGILNWESIYDCNWLEVIPRAGASRGDIIEVTLSVDISHLTWGNYDCELKILDPNAENSPLTVTVDLYVFVGDLVQVPSQAPTIQDAVDYVREGGTVVVADRVYTGRGNRDIDFKGKAITVRSENGPTNCIIDCQDSLGNGHHRGFYFHSGEDENSVLDGFMIINGSAVGCSVVQGGGAILCQSSSPTIANCIIRGNRTGGCIILESYGGGIALDKSSARISRCIISGNWAYEAGGGIICAEGSPIISNCIITGNSAEHGAGAAFIRSSPILTNCTFSANERDGVCCFSNSYIMIVTNSIFWDNAGPEIWLGTYTATMTISYSNVEDLTAGIHVEPDSTLNWGAGNISMDPCFVSMGHWDSNDTQMPYDDFWVDGYYHLKSQGGRWDTAIGSWIKDDVTSPCIDAGDPMSPVGLEPFPNGGRINMGAYGGTAEASKSYFGEPVCETIVAGDINGDCKVDFADFTIMAFHWLEDGRL